MHDKTFHAKQGSRFLLVMFLVMLFTCKMGNSMHDKAFHVMFIFMQEGNFNFFLRKVGELFLYVIGI